MSLTSVDQPATVILNMHYSGLAVARDLGQEGCRIIGLSSNPRFFGNYTRYADYRAYPDTEQEPDACVAFLCDLANELGHKPLLLATRDHDVRMILDHRNRLEEYFVLPYPDSAVVERIMDKAVLNAAAEAAGIYCPTTFEIRNVQDLDAIQTDVPFPAIIKPAHAADWRRDGIRDVVEKQKAIKVSNFDELRDLYERIEPFTGHAVIQELIEGPETDLVIFGSYRDEETGEIAAFTARKMLQYPFQAGTGVAVRAEPIPDIVEISKDLLGRLGYAGISEIEYKYDSRSGQYALIEINTRHWDQHGLGTKVGVNLTRTLYRSLGSGTVEVPQQRSRPVTWLAEDGFLLSILSKLRTHGPSWTIYWRIITGRCTGAVFSVRDPLPVLAQIYWGVAGIVERVFGALARRLGRQ